MRFNVTKMDSKGRISIPFSLRNLLEITHGDNLLLETDGKNGITATPVGRDAVNTGITKGFTKRYKSLVKSR